MAKPVGLSRLILTVALPVFLMPALGGADDDEKRPGADTIRQNLDKVIHGLEEKKKEEDKKNETAKEKETKAARTLSDLDAQLKAISKYEHGERELKGEVAGGFNGDKAPIEADGATETDPGKISSSNSEPTTSYKIDSTVTLTRGSYPQVFRVKTSVGVILTGKEFQEDVSSLQMSYGHYAAGGGVEIYGFTERISDSYLSIDQRWEVGGGTYFAFRRGLTKAAARDLLPLCFAPALADEIDDASKVRSLNGWGRKTAPCKPLENGAALTPPNPLHRPARERDWAGKGKGAATALPSSWPNPPAPPVPPCPPPADVAMYTTNCWDPVERTVLPAVFAGEPLPDVTRDEAAKEFYALRKLRADAIRSIEQRGARWELGVATSVLSEVERSTIKMLVTKSTSDQPSEFASVAGPNTETKSVTLGGEQTFRLTLRPTIRLRPSTHIYFEAFSYFKLRIPPGKKVKALTGFDETTQTSVFEMRRDWRADLHSELRYTLLGAETLGGEKFGVVASYDFHYDSAPPFVGADVLEDQGIVKVPGDGLSARQKHHVFKILLTVGWGG